VLTAPYSAAVREEVEVRRLQAVEASEPEDSPAAINVRHPSIYGLFVALISAFSS
jgi:hypothetical protein